MNTLDLQKPLEDYIAYFERLSPRSIRLIEKLADPHIQFIDPFNNVRGIDAFERVFKKMFADIDSPAFKIADHAWGRDGTTAYLRWTLQFYMRNKPHAITGMSEVSFSPQGKVISHIDYWDSGTQFYAELPGLGWIIRKIASKIAA